MTKHEKKKIVLEIKENLEKNNKFYITDTSGLTVSEINKFRQMCFKENLTYKVYKNTLIKKALETKDIDYSTYLEALKGTSGMIFVNEKENVPAKLIKKYKKEDQHNRPVFKVASIDSEIYLGENKLEDLCNLKSKEELIGEIINLLQSPINNVVMALQSSGNKLANILKKLSEK